MNNKIKKMFFTPLFKLIKKLLGFLLHYIQKLLIKLDTISNVEEIPIEHHLKLTVTNYVTMQYIIFYIDKFTLETALVKYIDMEIINQGIIVYNINPLETRVISPEYTGKFPIYVILPNSMGVWRLNISTTKSRIPFYAIQLLTPLLNLDSLTSPDTPNDYLYRNIPNEILNLIDIKALSTNRLFLSKEHIVNVIYSAIELYPGFFAPYARFTIKFEYISMVNDKAFRNYTVLTPHAISTHMNKYTLAINLTNYVVNFLESYTSDTYADEITQITFERFPPKLDDNINHNV